MSFESEYRALRETAGLIDLSSRGKIEVTGPDRVEVLQNILTQDVAPLKPGQSAYAALLTATAKVLADMNVFVFQDRAVLDTEPGVEKKLPALLEKFIIMEDASVKDATAGTTHLALEGPAAEKIAADLPGGFPMMRGFTGKPAFGFIVSKDEKEKIKSKILKRGAVEIGQEAFEAARIENGWLRYDVDMDESTPLPETGLDAVAASGTKGCYPGQEVVARTETYKGLLRKMVRLKFREGNVKAGDKIFSGEKEIGRITSACRLPSGRGRGLGYIAKGYFENPGEVTLAFEGKHLPAKSSALL